MVYLMLNQLALFVVVHESVTICLFMELLCGMQLLETACPRTHELSRYANLVNQVGAYDQGIQLEVARGLNLMWQSRKSQIPSYTTGMPPRSSDLYYVRTRFVLGSY